MAERERGGEAEQPSAPTSLKHKNIKDSLNHSEIVRGSREKTWIKGKMEAGKDVMGGTRCQRELDGWRHAGGGKVKCQPNPG